ncbi:MAG: alpha/beta hydrolase [Sphingomonadaceae bacterium]|nr:alpha/beta hydrolase [Sphingomonadaceae bacterium]
MASLQARAFAFFLRTTGFVRKNFTGGPTLRQSIEKARQAPRQLPTAKQQAKLNIREEAFDGHPVWHIAPKQGSGRTLLYFHGGGYVYAASNFHWAFLCHLAEAYNISIIAPLYPLAPEHSAETTTRFALDIYRQVLASCSAEDLVVGGDSAGGGLTAATLMAARDAGLPMPARALLICPWLNAEPDHPDQAIIEPRDAILTRSGIADAGRIYAGALSVQDPRVSPIHGDWSGFPPLYVLSGGDDILVADARALQARLPDHVYQEEAGMIHDWPIFTFPESRAAQRRMAEFITA